MKNQNPSPPSPGLNRIKRLFANAAVRFATA